MNRSLYVQTATNKAFKYSGGHSSEEGLGDEGGGRMRGVFARRPCPQQWMGLGAAKTRSERLILDA
jgi:hypothetical protein